MLRIRLLFILQILSASVFANTDIELVYSDIRFKIPGNFSVIGDAGDSQNILIFRYGDEPGKMFLAFSDLTNDKSINYGCPTNIFFHNVFFDSDESGCDPDKIRLIKGSFVENRSVERWSSKKYSIAYSSNKEKSYIFIIGDNGKLVKIDSDFLKKESLKRVAMGI